MYNKRIHFLNFAFILIVFLLFNSCHTFVFQPIKKQIQGTWELSSNDTITKEVWTFDAGKLSILFEDRATGFQTFHKFQDPGLCDTTKVPSIDYKIQNKITKHYLVTDGLALHTVGSVCGTKGTNEDPGKWLIIKVSKKWLYLSSEHKQSDHKTKGSSQIGFKKI